MLYFQARSHLDFIDDLIRMASSEKDLPRPKDLSAQFSLPFLNSKTEIQEKLAAELQRIRQQMGESAAIAVLTSLDLGFHNWNLTFGVPTTDAFWTVQAVPVRPNQQFDHQPATAWLAAVAKAFSAHPDHPPRPSVPVNDVSAVEAQIAASRRMEAVAAQIAEQLGRVAIERDNAFATKHEKLDASVAAAREQLTQERTQFEQEKAERDSREATVVRRQLLSDTLRALDSQPAVILSKETNQKRSSIAVALWLAMSLGVALLAITIFQDVLFSTKTTEGAIILRTLAVSGALLFATALWYFVRWQDRWQQLHAAAELQNRKNRTDILRASWLAELVIETGKEEKLRLPDALLAELSHGLFVAPHEPTVTEHPLEVLFKRAGLEQLKIGKGGIELAKDSRRSQ